MKNYRQAYALRDYSKALEILEKSSLKEEKRNILLWHLEKGSVALSLGNEDEAISHFQTSLDVIENLYTKSVSKKVVALMVNDTKDVFYGASYERSYAHYFLAKSLYARYLKTTNKLDLQGARAAILSWDSYFTDYQRSLSKPTLYSTDLMLKVFGGQIHEVSQIRSDKQIALQLYKDALKILETQGGIYPLFNKKAVEYTKHFEQKNKAEPKLFETTPEKADLEKFLHYKVLSLTKEIRGFEFEKEAKALKASSEVIKKAAKGAGNLVLVFEEGLIPQKVAKKFNFGIRGAIDKVESPAAKAFISTVGVSALTAFAMNKLNMVPEGASGAGNFIFAHDVTRLAVQEAAVAFELPTIESVPLVKRVELFILNDQGKIIRKAPLPVVSENGSIARVVLEEDIVSQYVKVGTRVALKHLVAIVSAMQVYQRLQKGSQNDLLAKTAALATYVTATKGIEYMEQADTRHWTTLPQALRMAEFKLKPGTYQVALAPYEGDKAPESPTKTIGKVQVPSTEKVISTFQLP